MRRLTTAIAAMAGATMLAASPAGAEQPFSPNSFQNLAHVFNAADLDRDGTLSAREFVMLRTGTIDQAWLRDYRGDGYKRMVPTLVRSFSQLDRDNDGVIARTEFMNVANDPLRTRTAAASADRWDWQPEYMTLTYYLIANPVDADRFQGRQVVNLEGEAVGTIHSIARDEDSGNHYALVSVAARVMDRTPTRFRAAVIGVPLEDILLSASGESLMLSERGERYLLTDAELPRVDIEELEEVDTLYRV